MAERKPSNPALGPRKDLECLPYYNEIKNQIIESEKVVVSTQYLWDRWAPRLGPVLTNLIVILRRHCYYNKMTRERRDWCFPSQDHLARAVGVKDKKTIAKALENPWASYFISRQAQYQYDAGLKKKIRKSDLYSVAMDDPLTPEDEAHLLHLMSERIKEISVSQNDRLPESKKGTKMMRLPESIIRTQDKTSPHHDFTEFVVTGSAKSRRSSLHLDPKIVPEEVPGKPANSSQHTKQDDVLNLLKTMGITPAMARRLASKHDANYLRKKIQVIRQYLQTIKLDSIRNIPGFIVKCIEEDYQLELEPAITMPAGKFPKPGLLRKTAQEELDRGKFPDRGNG